jgi:hypothetical protein
MQPTTQGETPPATRARATHTCSRTKKNALDIQPPRMVSRSCGVKLNDAAAAVRLGAAQGEQSGKGRGAVGAGCFATCARRRAGRTKGVNGDISDSLRAAGALRGGRGSGWLPTGRAGSCWCSAAGFKFRRWGTVAGAPHAFGSTTPASREGSGSSTQIPKNSQTHRNCKAGSERTTGGVRSRGLQPGQLHGVHAVPG